MPDRWFDSHATAEEVASKSRASCARFLGGVCRKDAGFPSREDGDYRRAGMVNFKFAMACNGSQNYSCGGPPTALKNTPVDAPPTRTVSPGSAMTGLQLVIVSRMELATILAQVVGAEESANCEAFNVYLKVVASLLGLLADELATSASVSAFVVISSLEELRKTLRVETVEGETDLACRLREGSGHSIFDSQFSAEMVGLAQRYKGGRDDFGGPLDGGFVVSQNTGEVHAAAVRFLKGSQPACAAEVAATLNRGMALTRSDGGNLIIYLAPEVRKGRALCLEPLVEG